MKVILQNPTASMAVIEKLVSLWLGANLLAPTIVLNTVLTLLATEVKQEKEIMNLSLFFFVDDMGYKLNAQVCYISIHQQLICIAPNLRYNAIYNHFKIMKCVWINQPKLYKNWKL